MKAISPVRSVRSCYEAVCCISEQSLSISRSRSPSEEPVGALNDMNDCYSRLKELVPSIPQNKSVSQIEILQHVIDYIFDLQIALESPTGAPDMLKAALKSSEIKHSLSKESDGALCH
ncbi:DNA-binding protein inhibitor ID-3 [Ictalurus punctatus]|uniref:DNA-binding protein inhibitor ID-4 n=1 Tax=Ictalurus punctatus TaxID=7998 RepID=W5UJ06_ICTPU|nr:DNA-binding protein inhibitor ID-3 [Ictalurus punctatus]XP_053489746.1 DNA-binding protein inhibitor ID-3 [Ictalurus furcatus]